MHDNNYAFVPLLKLYPKRCRRNGGTVPRIINLGTGMRRAASLVSWSLFYENGNLMNRRARLIFCGKQTFVPIPGTKSRFIGPVSLSWSRYWMKYLGS